MIYISASAVSVFFLAEAEADYCYLPIFAGYFGYAETFLEIAMQTCSGCCDACIIEISDGINGCIFAVFENVIVGEVGDIEAPFRDVVGSGWIAS